MQISHDGIELVKSFEGCETVAYQDSVGRWTIGYGHTAGVSEGMNITQQQAEDYLATDLLLFERLVNYMVEIPLQQHQFDALVSFTYNLGGHALKHSELLAFVNAGRFAQAADAFLEYDHAGGVVVPGLLRRRQAERALFLAPTVPTQRMLRRLLTWWRR